ncbi:MAG: LamG-like jellyroll fold domain-containing protein [Chloroflexota bacterium]|nr:LamG-like jellyroll fold domain-containing protein [Chloroflexota bacterium]
MQHYFNDKGFTLAELLVVIAIMAVLIGVAVGAFTGLIGSGESESAKYEKEAVQTAVESYMSVNATGTITARTTAAAITETDADAPFKTFLRRLPTEYTYSWTDKGIVSQSENSDGGGSSLPTAIAQWHLNEGSGTTAQDAIGGNHGTIFGATWTTDGVSGNALDFDGSGDYINTSLAANTLTGDYTFEAWVKANTIPNYGGIITSNQSSPYNGFNLQVGTSQRIAICAMSGGGFTYTRTSWAPTIGVWYHIVGVHDSSTDNNTLYVNGSYMDSDTQTVTMPNLNVMIGRFYSSYNGHYFNGIIDEVAIYDEALTETEIQALFNALDPS